MATAWNSMLSNARGDYVRPGTPLGQQSSMFPNFRSTIGPGYTTPELESVALNTLRSKLAHDALTLGRNAQAERDNLLLRSVKSHDLANLFTGKPNNEREAELYRIINKDALGKSLGESLIPSWQQVQAHERGRLSNIKLGEDIKNSRFSRDFRTDQLDQQQLRDIQTAANYQAQRAHDTQQLAAQERNRQAQIQNAEANRVQRGQQFSQNQMAREFQTMLAMERMLQDQADEEARQGRGLFQDVSEAAEAGAIPPDDIRRMFGNRLDPSMLGLAEGYGRQYQQGENAFKQYLDMQAADFNQRLQADPASMYTIRDELRKDPNASGRIVYNPNTQSFQSLLAQAQAQGYSPDLSGFDLGTMPDYESFDMDRDLADFGMMNLPVQQGAPPPVRAAAAAPAARPRSPAPPGVPNGARVRSGGRLWQNQNGYMVPVG